MYYKLSIESFSQKILYNFYLQLIPFLNNKLYLNYRQKKVYFFINSTIFFLHKNIKKYTLNRSPHVNKKAREQFETRIYKAIILLKLKNLVLLKKRDLLFIFYILKKFINSSSFSSLIRSKLILFLKDSVMKSFSIKKNRDFVKKKNRIVKNTTRLKIL